LVTVFTTHHIDAKHEDLTNRHDSENGDEHLAKKFNPFAKLPLTGYAIFTYVLQGGLST